MKKGVSKQKGSENSVKIIQYQREKISVEKPFYSTPHSLSFALSARLKPIHSSCIHQSTVINITRIYAYKKYYNTSCTHQRRLGLRFGHCCLGGGRSALRGLHLRQHPRAHCFGRFFVSRGVNRLTLCCDCGFGLVVISMDRMGAKSRNEKARKGKPACRKYRTHLIHKQSIK